MRAIWNEGPLRSYIQRQVAWVPPGHGEWIMCGKCVEIDKKINHYRQLGSSISDQRTNDGINDLVEKLKAEKAALHPEQK